MISRSGKDNFLIAHYDWVAAGVGALALAGSVAYCLFGGDVGERIEEKTARLDAAPGKGSLVAAEDMSAFAAATNTTKARARATFVLGKVGATAGDLARRAELEPAKKRDDLSDAEKAEMRKLSAMIEAGSFFSSNKRLLCSDAGCSRLTPEKFDAAGNLVCAFCGATQAVAKVEAVVVADKDEDGLPDDWERRYGLNPKDSADAAADKDGDTFTNLEEFKAGTDPTDKASHPDHLDSLKLQTPFEETRLPFVFIKATKIPSGWRCEFFNAREKDDYGRAGRTITAVIGEEIGTSGFVLKGYAPKEAKVAFKGGEGLTKKVDASEATIERKRDGKKLTLVVAASKKAKPMAVDVQAKLVYTRGSERTFDVVVGSEFVLAGGKYRVVEIVSAGKDVGVVLEDLATKRKKKISP